MKIGPTTELCYFGMALAGVGPGLLLVTTVVRSQRAAISNGYQNGLSTYFLISGNILLIQTCILCCDVSGYYSNYVIFDKIAGLCTSSWFLGLFLGPTIGGFLVEHYGFPQSAFMYTLFFIFTTFLDIAGVTCKKCNHPKGYMEVKE